MDLKVIAVNQSIVSELTVNLVKLFLLVLIYPFKTAKFTGELKDQR